KLIRLINTNLLSLVNSEQLFNCANIQVINTFGSTVFSLESLKKYDIATVSVIDILNCFPDNYDATNIFRNEFKNWSQKQEKEWWILLFQQISVAIETDKMISQSLMEVMRKKPLFLLRLVDKLNHRQYLPSNLQLFITDNNDLQNMWKTQLLILSYQSEFERKILLDLNIVQLLTNNYIIKIYFF
ncbi:unnamed protein product, partial [Didymodactylos carnosus]